MKILIVKIGAIGDVAMALTMVDTARRMDPHARLTWLCGRSVQPLLEAHGGIDEIIAVDDVRLLRGSFTQRLGSIIGVWRRLAGRPFDVIVTGHSDWRYRVLSATARSKIRRSFGARAGGPWLPPARYHADEYARLITGTASANAMATPLPRLQPPLDSRLAGELPSDGSWVALAPGGARNILRDDALRRWPVGSYAALTDRLLEAGYRVFLTGGAGDEWVRESFSGRNVVDWIGKTSLVDLIALYGRCKLVVTHDSGPLHLASLAGTPVLALFGPTSPQEKVSPVGSVRVLWGGAHLACRPCYDGLTYADCSRNACLEDVSVETVYAEAKRILGERG